MEIYLVFCYDFGLQNKWKRGKRMHKIWRRTMAALMAALMVSSSGVAVYAESDVNLQEAAETYEEACDTEYEDVEDTSVDAETDTSTAVDTEAVSETDSGDNSEENCSEAVSGEDTYASEDYIFNYVYIECPVIYQNDVQVVGVNIENLDNRKESIEDIRLGYFIEGTAYESSYSTWEDNLVLFESTVTQVGTYTLSYVDIVETDDVVHMSLDDEDIAITDAQYYVIEDYECYEDYTCYDDASLEQDSAAKVRTLTSDGIQFDVQQMNPVGSDGKVVVVIDPGHDSLHTGASGNGLREEVLTLKIAQYCRAELETYDNVTVYMTRTDGSCLDSSGKGACLKARCDYAASVNANLLVSIHIDSGSVTASGAMVIVAKMGVYRDDLAQVTQNVGKAILAELTKVGLASRGLYIRMSDSSGAEYIYPNGAVADYYAITRNCIRAGIPGIIVEHCFISNPSDAANYLSSEEKLKKLGVADATGIANYFKLSKGSGEECFDVGEALYDSSMEPYEITGENISDFVATVYENALGRTPKRTEVSYWVRKIETSHLSGTQLVGFFLNSPEFVNKEYSDEEYVERLYHIYLNRDSDTSGKAYWVSQLAEKERSAVAGIFATTDEFTATCARYGMKQGNYNMQYTKLYPAVAELVKNYYTGLMGRTPDSGGMEYWTKYIIRGGSVSNLTKQFIYSEEFLNRDISKEDFVDGVYLTYLNRTPDANGKAYWVSQMEDLSGESKIKVIRGFIFSKEYQELCEKYGIRMGSL
jgi:N-acetylmuramoyl-L-alanine amidase